MAKHKRLDWIPGFARRGLPAAAPFLARAARLAAALALAGAGPAGAALKNVLIFSNTAGYRHTEGIADANTMFDSLARVKGFTVTKTEDPNFMTYANMKKFDVLVFNNTTGPVLPNVTQQNDFIKYLTEGGGWFGFHGAMDHHGYWQWYTDQGVDFSGHSTGQPNCQVDTAAAIKKAEYADIVSVFPKTPWVWDEEWYAFKENPRRNSDILITVDEASNNWVIPASLRMGDHPVAWAHRLPALAGSAKQGRYIYTLMGHGGIGRVFKGEKYVNEFFYQALRWAADDVNASSVDRPASRFLTPALSRSGSFAPGQIDVSVSELGRHRVEVLDLSGRVLASAEAAGPSTHVFSGMKSNGVNIVRVQTSQRPEQQPGFGALIARAVNYSARISTNMKSSRPPQNQTNFASYGNIRAIPVTPAESFGLWGHRGLAGPEFHLATPAALRYIRSEHRLHFSHSQVGGSTCD